MQTSVYTTVIDDITFLWAQLVAVSKKQSIEKIVQVYEEWQRNFGENYVQEMVEKYTSLQEKYSDIRRHMIWHLQTNKVKYIAPFVHMIQSVDSWKLLEKIAYHAEKCARQIPCLLQVYLGAEESKYGLTPDELTALLQQYMADAYVRERAPIHWLMMMTTLTTNEELQKTEYSQAQQLFAQIKAVYFRDDSDFSVLSMGMSCDYDLALQYGSTMVRIGSKIFGARW